MKIADFFRGVATATMALAVNVFHDAKTLVANAPLPQNLKDDLTKTLDDGAADLEGLAGLGGTELGAIVADVVDDATTFFANVQQRIAQGQPLTAAGRTALAQTLTAAKAQLTALEAQTHAGLDVLAGKAAGGGQ